MIDLNDVRFAYPDAPDKTVLDIPHWAVAAGDHVFVHGPSGSGKSTLLNLVSGMLAGARGEVSILGENLEQMNNRQRDRFRANHIGYVFQQFNLLPYLSAVDNIQLASHFCQGRRGAEVYEDIEALLTTLNLPTTDWHKPAARLSIGQQQRVAIARALINKPELLIADEPTSALDEANSENFMAMLLPQLQANNTTLLFVSHDLSLSHYFQRVDALNAINRAGGHG